MIEEDEITIDVAALRRHLVWFRNLETLYIVEKLIVGFSLTPFCVYWGIRIVNYFLNGS